eukprot:s1879_g3.t1
MFCSIMCALQLLPKGLFWIIAILHQGKRPVVCGQNQLFHQGLHRSDVLVRTVDAGWLQHISEWLQGGVTYAWPGEFTCSESVAQASNQAVLTASLLEQVEEYKVEKCLEGLAPKVGTPWVLKAGAEVVSC